MNTEAILSSSRQFYNASLGKLVFTQDNIAIVVLHGPPYKRTINKHIGSKQIVFNVRCASESEYHSLLSSAHKLRDIPLATNPIRKWAEKVGRFEYSEYIHK